MAYADHTRDSLLSVSVDGNVHRIIRQSAGTRSDELSNIFRNADRKCLPKRNLTMNEGAAWFADREIKSFLSEAESEFIARSILSSVNTNLVDDLVLMWKKADRLEELPKVSEWLFKKFGELRGAQPLEAETHYALSELAWIESGLSAADKAHIYVLGSKAWRDFLDAAKRKQVEDDSELQDLYLQHHLDLGIAIGIYLEQQPLPPYFEDAASTAHEIAHRAFQAPYW